jgi:hypothetical protein
VGKTVPSAGVSTCWGVDCAKYVQHLSVFDFLCVSASLESRVIEYVDHQNIDEDDDMLSAMARELLERNGIGETADAVWKALNTEHQKLFPTTSQSSDRGSPDGQADVLISPPFDTADLAEAALGAPSVVAFGQRPESLAGRRRRGRPVVSEQPSLFSLS